MHQSPDVQPGAIPAATDVATAFGRVRIIWVRSDTGPKVQRIILPGDLRADPAMNGEMLPVPEPRDESIRALMATIRLFLQGDDVRFDIDLLDLERCPPFQRRVLLAEYGIPRGYVSTYGRIARHIGSPRASRSVGSALARNPFPLVIPCHRALRSDGRPGGFQGGLAMKRRLLEMEGVRFREDGRVLMENVWY
ncbi:MAG: methylated-DNA-[protein]-cysteine S-methyltransferase [Euryarchaeota archaeon]|jgi:methylated-DNA-[protein]-cysteine S-methyltransferase|nr:methylated-DNA-[protein]-cysteine S-methyltransferase [Euryarchaeota archaeon]MDN5340494.1 methylated-DNA-[protein]-cysteine S-methyltransferase [Euryarchaeota archaeon]